ncbi:MAG TPA: GldG family protein, partial [Methylomirabilota bacterium]|nr:GldG family protein [Methylomirabilota bacterium]
MKQKKFETLLYSSAGVLVMLVIIIAINIITAAFKTRLDLTEEKAYTLNAGTRRILEKIDGPVEIRLYYSQSEARMPSMLKAYARQIEDLLGEFRQASRGNIEIKKFDPEPDSEAEELAQLDGIEPQLLSTGDQIYLGVAISQDPVKVALPFLSPDRERMLEYDLARALAKVISTNKPVIGVMTPLPLFGSPMNPMMMRMGQQGQEPWAVINELKRDFDVRQVQMDAEKIDDDIRVLLVIHPKDIKDTAQYAIDQFVLRGGKLIALLDATAV